MSEWLESRERRDQIRRMLQKSGALLGHGANNTAYYTLDGKLYADLSTTQLHELGDYHEYCAMCRRLGEPKPWDPIEAWTKPYGVKRMRPGEGRKDVYFAGRKADGTPIFAERSGALAMDGHDANLEADRLNMHLHRDRYVIVTLASQPEE